MTPRTPLWQILTAAATCFLLSIGIGFALEAALEVLRDWSM